MPSPTKLQRRRLRELAAEAHTRELTQAMKQLHQEFERWGGSSTGVFELNELEHKFHNGISRELYSRYVTAPAELAVIHALRSGVLRRDEVGDDLIAALGAESGNSQT